MSEIRATTISDAAGTGPITLTAQSSAKCYACTAYQTTILESFNTSSMTDTSSGNGDMNWTSAMSNAHYSSPANTSYVSGSGAYCVTHGDASGYQTRTASKWYFRTVYSDSGSSAFYDSFRGSVTIHGDLA